jgi:hypothetical protein
MNTQKKRHLALTILSFVVLFAGLVSLVGIGGTFSPSVHAQDTCTNPQAENDVGVDPECVKNTGEVKLTNQQAKDAGLQPKSADKLVGQTLDGVYTIVAIIAVLVIVIAGLRIITADGDANKVATARQMVIYAAVGLVIVGSAFIITGVVQGIGTK